MSVSVPIKVLGFTKSISINLIVKKIEGTDLFLSYDGKMGIDLLVSPAISYAKKLVPEKACFVEQMPGNIVKLRLGDIDKLQKVFEKVKLNNILFEQEDIVVEVKDCGIGVSVSVDTLFSVPLFVPPAWYWSFTYLVLEC